MRKVISILFVFSLVLIIAGCNKNTTKTTVQPHYNWTAQPGQWDATIGEYRPESGAKLKLWVDDATWAEALIAEYNKYFPEVPVTYEVVGSVDTRAKMELDGPAGLGADVFVMPHDHIGAALNGNLIGPVGDYETALRTRTIATSLESVTANKNGQDQIFAFPISGESLALFYNKTIIASKNEQVVTTWEEIIAQSKKYTDLDNKFYWIGMDAGNAYDMNFIATAHGYELFGPTHKDPNKVNFNTPEMVAALTWHHNFRVNALNVDTGSISGENNRANFEGGNMAYIVDGPWSIARYKKAGIDFAVVKLPTMSVNGTQVQPYTFSGNQLAAVSTFTNYPAAARTLANFMTTVPGEQVMYNVGGKLPTLIDTSGIQGLQEDPYLKGISDQLGYSIPMPTLPEMSYFWTYAGAMYGNAWNAALTPAEAAAKAQADYDTARALGQ